MNIVYAIVSLVAIFALLVLISMPVTWLIGFLGMRIWRYAKAINLGKGV